MRIPEQRSHRSNLVGLGRLELPTSPLSGVRSNQLSYRPSFFSIYIKPANCVDTYSHGCEVYKKCRTQFFVYTKDKHSCKEVIQPQVPLRLPCYDFTPVMNHTVVIVLPKVKLTTSGAAHSHGVTGGVYKARERIHRGILIHDY
jgi:hypothetical protein